jgi:orotidine-5'-phosphate decarboxylase
MLINVSRGISRSENPRKAAVELRDRIVNIQFQMKH